MKIYQCLEISPDVLLAFGKLIPQLGNDCKIPSKEYLEDIIKSNNSYLFLVKEEGIVGTLTLILNQMPSGKKAWIEDVVVDEKMRGKGIAKELIKTAIEFTQSKEISKIDLTSRPEKTAANQLYKKLGFKQRETNVYRFED